MKQAIAIINEVENQRPYKRPGNRDSYSQYNEGWSDACDEIRQQLQKALDNSSSNQSGKEEDYVPGVPAEDSASVASHSCAEGNSIEPFSCEIKITVHKSNRLKGMFDIDSSEYGFHYCDIYNTLEGLQNSLPKGKEWVEDRVKSYCRVLVTAAQGIDALLSQLQNDKRSVATDDQ